MSSRSGVWRSNKELANPVESQDIFSQTAFTDHLSKFNTSLILFLHKPCSTKRIFDFFNEAELAGHRRQHSSSRTVQFSLRNKCSRINDNYLMSSLIMDQYAEANTFLYLSFFIKKNTIEIKFTFIFIDCLNNLHLQCVQLCIPPRVWV